MYSQLNGLQEDLQDHFILVFFNLPGHDKTELLPKEHFGDLSGRAAQICGGKDIRAAWTRLDGCILALITLIDV